MYKFTGEGKDAHATTSAHMFSLTPVLLLCSIATSTSTKKEINGPGASERPPSPTCRGCLKHFLIKNGKIK